MEILFIPKGLGDDLMNLPIGEISSNELKEIQFELSELDNSLSIKQINLGEGSDWVLILATLSGISSFIALGEKIEKGIDGWIKIGRRLNKICSNLDVVYFDKTGAFSIALDYLSRSFDLKNLRLVMDSELSVKDLSQMLPDRKRDEFIARPYKVHFMAFEINDKILITLGIRSDGEINKLYTFDKNLLVPF